MPLIRVVALALVRRPGTRQILVHEGYDTARDLRYRRPMGGGVEFGETSTEAVVRELYEEIGVRATTHGIVGTFETVFTHDGVPKHEVLFVHDVTLDDPAAYDLDLLVDVETGEEPGIWHDLDDPPPGIVLFPQGLGDLVRAT